MIGLRTAKPKIKCKWELIPKNECKLAESNDIIQKPGSQRVNKNTKNIYNTYNMPSIILGPLY